MKKFKLIPLAVLASLTMSSCSDLLIKDSEDQVTIEQYLTNDANLEAFTYHLYGPYTWNKYELKFSWCANELTVGNVYHNYADEGAFFFLTFDQTNGILADGYDGLYGLIGRCNGIINDLDVQCGPGISFNAKQRAKGEAYLFRAYAYFLLTEFWGETFIVNNSSKVIMDDAAFMVPKASRACLYAQVERDLTLAAQLLPDERWGKDNQRPSNAAAFGMLGKLYLTMAAASTNDPAVGEHVFHNEFDFATYNTLAINNINEALLRSGAPMESKDNYENLFWPKNKNAENLFSLYFEQGNYGAGSARQVMFSRSKFMDGGDDYYGGEKGLTYTLFKSFEDEDVRKKACCYYTTVANDLPKEGSLNANAPTAGRNPIYKMYEDQNYAYYYNPSKTFEDSPYGSEPESPCLNACRKFVYGVHLLNKFSAPLTFPILRTADLYLMRAEATMALETGANAVSQKSAIGLADINLVRERAGLAPKTLPVALYDTDPEQKTTFQDDRDPDKVIPYEYTSYSNTYDLLEERRHEFALECQNWLDLKRIYYRNAFAGNEFVIHQDRGWTMGQRLGVEDFAKGESQYQRTKELHMADNSLPDEKPVNSENVQWFFPLPSIIQSIGITGPVFNDVNAIKTGAYPY